MQVFGSGGAFELFLQKACLDDVGLLSVLFQILQHIGEEGRILADADAVLPVGFPADLPQLPVQIIALSGSALCCRFALPQGMARGIKAPVDLADPGTQLPHDPDDLIRPVPEEKRQIFLVQLGQNRRILQNDGRRVARKALDHSHFAQEIVLLQNGDLLFTGCPVIGIDADRACLDDVHAEGQITLPEKNLSLGSRYCLHFESPLPSQPFSGRFFSTAVYFAILARSSSFF